MMPRLCWSTLPLVTVLAVGIPPLDILAQDLEDDRARGVRMLRDIRSELKVWYHDPTFHGLDLDDHFAQAAERVKAAGSQALIAAHIAQALMGLDDSHTYFIPPPLSVSARYGFVLGMVGDRCLVMAVDPDSTAHKDGLRAGMEVMAVQGARPTRGSLWKITYSLNALRPRREIEMVLRPLTGTAETRTIHADLTPPRQYQRFEDWIEALLVRLQMDTAEAVQTADVGEDILVAKVATFSLEDQQIDGLMRRARGKGGLVLDLRANPGGAVDGLKRLAGYFFPQRTKIGQLKTRKKLEDLHTDRRPADQIFGGKVVALLDSASASASEVLARTLQLAGRATIVGDKSAGAVMVSSSHVYTDGHEGRFVLYGLSISEAQLLMSDGVSLEQIGVTPDEILLPSPEDLAAGLDPVLARAITLLGGNLNPQAAGALFPRRWN
jgi:C-terminal processing protease CtpA/Prc